MKPTHIEQIAAWMALPFEGSSLTRMIHGVSVDSRLTGAGELFFALPGETQDGHSFLSAAAGKGARAAVVHVSYAGPDHGLLLLRSSDCLHSLQLLAQNYLQQSKAAVVAVTGSLGKTTTKEFLTTLLKQRYRVASNAGNQNSQIGVPLTILNQVLLDEEMIVLEMGMTQLGQIAKLVQIAPPDAALVTLVAPVHIGNFASLEQIAQAKAEIFSHPRTKWGLYHQESDLKQQLSLVGSCRKLSFSTESTAADYYLTPDHQVHRLGACVALAQLSVPGEHNRHNLLGAVAVTREFGLSWEEINAAIPHLSLPESRLQLIEKEGIKFINDAYNASEISIKAALRALPEPARGGKRCAVLGGIVELGIHSEQTHRNVGQFALDYLDQLFCFGEECLVMVEQWQAAQKPVFWARERSGLLPALHSYLHPGDLVLLKGSHIKAVWKLLDEFSLSKGRRQ